MGEDWVVCREQYTENIKEEKKNKKKKLYL